MTNFDLSDLALDEVKSNEGVWEPIGGDAELLVARIGGEAWTRAYRKIPRHLRRQIDTNELRDDVGLDIMCRLLSKAVLLDWKNMAEKGKQIPYSQEAAYKMLKKYERFRTMVWELGNDLNRFKAEEVEEDLKNSESAFDGNLTSEE